MIIDNIKQFCIENSINYIIEEDDIYLCLPDIGRYGEYGNIRTSLINIPKKYIKQFKLKDCNMVLQSHNFINTKGLKLLICKSRKSKMQYLAEIININIEDNLYITVENETLDYIKKIFKNENIKKQYHIDKYFIDLYFIDYKIAIECDENHNGEKVIKDIERENKIKSLLDCKFIRYKPFDKNFDICNVINQIYMLIINNKNNRIENLESELQKVV